MVEKTLTGRQQAKKDQIVKAARQLFLEKGYANTTMDAVTQAAGISKQTLYVYFPSKEDLFEEVLQEMVKRIQDLVQGQTVADLPAGPAGLVALETQLVKLAMGVLGIMMQPDYLALLRIILAEGARFPYLNQLFQTNVPQRGLQALIFLLSKGQAQNLIEIEDYEIAGRAFIGPMFTFAVLDGLFLPPGKVPQVPEQAKVEKLIRIYLNGIKKT